jgi:REP element-mobilizing transposase RayT
MQRKDPFVPENYYHIYNRGIDKRVIFKSPHDYQRFAMLLYAANSQDPIRLDDLINKRHKNYKEIFEVARGKPLVSIGAWSLMNNHFHILLREESEGGVSKFTKKFGTGYSMYFNIKYQRTGGLFGGPFKSKYISDDLYLKHLFGYIHLNPLDIEFSGWEKLVDKKHSRQWGDFLKNYPHSSYQDYLGTERPEQNILSKEAFPDYFEEENSFKDFIDSYLSFDPRVEG